MQNNYFIQQNTCLSTKYNILNTNQLSQNFVFALQKKAIVVSNLLLSNKDKKINIIAHVFYKTSKLRLYKTKSKEKLNLKKDFLNITNLLDTKNVTVTVKNLNLLINERELLVLFDVLKKYSGKLFNKRIYLFCDVLKLLLLISEKKASVWSLIFVLAQAFKPLQKKQHGMFISFLKEIFNYFVKNNKLIGVKIILAGRLKGKPMASFSKLNIGKIGLNTQRANIQNAQTHIYTIYGCFGLKLWINYKN